MYIKRSVTPLIQSTLDRGKIAIVYGARQVGKTTLAKEISKSYKKPLYLNCDDPSVVSSLTEKSAIELKSYIGDSDLVVIDEAQRVENIGISIKLIHDTYPEYSLLITGSSSLDLANKVTEPLTGRSIETILYPLSVREVSAKSSDIPLMSKTLLDRGGYPGMWHLSAKEAHEQLTNIANNYIFKDALSPAVIYDQTTVTDLLRLLAFQVGHEVNYTELATKLSISKDTVQRYIDLLEKAFIVFRRNQYRRNLRSEVGRLRKVYFYDLGIRNALIDNFKPADLRDDMGQLWENYCIVERLKYLQFGRRSVRSFYWRNPDGREIDIVEEESDQIRAYECKLSPSKSASKPAAFGQQYPTASYTTINPNTLSRDFLSPSNTSGNQQDSQPC